MRSSMGLKFTRMAREARSPLGPTAGRVAPGSSPMFWATLSVSSSKASSLLSARRMLTNSRAVVPQLSKIRDWVSVRLTRLVGNSRASGTTSRQEVEPLAVRKTETWGRITSLLTMISSPVSGPST